MPEHKASPDLPALGAVDPPEDLPDSPISSDYDRRYYQSGLGPPYEESEPHWRNFFSHVAEEIVRQLSPGTVLDAGCATGFLVAALAEKGVDAAGIDISEYAVAAAVTGAQGRIRVQSLTDPIEGRWDLIVCIEVLEHMAGPDIQKAIDNICNSTNRVLFSSTPHDFAEPSHINVKPVPLWISWFAQRGFFRRADIDASFLSPWAALLERKDLSTAELAYSYEAEMTPLREELVTKRGALLDANREIGNLQDRLASGRGVLDAGDKEFETPERLLALIDEVIGLQTQLAELRYQHDRELADIYEEKIELQASLDDVTNRAEGAENRVNEMIASKSWQIGQYFARPVYFLRKAIRRR